MSRTHVASFAPALAPAAVLLLVLPVAAHANPAALAARRPARSSRLRRRRLNSSSAKDLDGGFSRVQLFDSRNQLASARAGPG